ncbi:dTDP-4-dehydrorhamnose 3,5-epimerase [Hyphomonas sp.]|uniref:dTDP-4-dehydrorhamnose 3,5-epimerase n=1 Tax=Hyphomonas sp. TaxID=87 RepID=UPI001BCB5715|nr:dTDP-4-dehydrorhamnose 3,5-epimerase [Hyphomonas sp.]
MSLTVCPDPILPEVLHVLPARHVDARGWFSETYNSEAFRRAGIECDFVQDNQSRSEKAGTIRGLHFQKPPHAQAKLIRCARGRILDVAVDIRAGSPRFGVFTLVELSADTGLQLFIPAGFAHGFCTLEDGCEVAYKVDAFFAPGCDAGIAYNDPDIGIGWPFPEHELLLSDKDRKLPRLKDL